jgi:hypothetical protein
LPPWVLKALLLKYPFLTDRNFADSVPADTFIILSSSLLSALTSPAREGIEFVLEFGS